MLEDRSGRSGSLVVQLALLVACIGLVYWAYQWFGWFQDSLASTFSGREMWRWFVGSALLVLAGIAAGLIIRTRGYPARRACALALLPFVLAMAFPAWVWGWYAPAIGSWVWHVWARLLSLQWSIVLWLLVGLSLSGALTSQGRILESEENAAGSLVPGA